ncbi:MAG: hypothetical protein HY558_01880 [Euryarchaeota archaeon]|nr:hypothetical protein [Euryarchaeota archaeon]
MFGRERRGRGEPLVLDLEGLEALLRERRDVSSGGPEGALDVVRRILAMRDELEGVLASLESRPSDHLFKAIATARPQYVKGMRNALKTLRPREPWDLPRLMEFYEASRGALQAMQGLELGPGKYLARGYREEMRAIARLIRDLIPLAVDLGHRVEERHRGLSRLDTLLSEASALRARVAEQRAHQAEKSRHEAEAARLESHRDQQKARFTALDTGPGAQEVRGLEARIQAAREARARLEAELRQRVDPLGRALRKFQKLETGTSTLGAPLQRALSGFLAQSGEAILKDPAAPWGPLLLAVREAIDTGRLALEESEEIKTLERLDFLLEGHLEEYLARQKQSTAEEARASGVLASHPVARERQEVLHLLLEAEENLRREQGLLASLGFKDDPQAIEGLKRTLEASLSALEGRPVEIRL